jgi:predicted anti-sigma-YlaC factor YlaD
MSHVPDAEFTCREMVELVSDYLEEALADRDRALFEQHLVLCDGCTAYLDQMRRTLALIGRLRDDALDTSLRGRLLETFRAWKRNGGASAGG